MNIAGFAKRILPTNAYQSVVRIKKQRERARIARLPAITEKRFAQILVEDLRITSGDVVFVHSSLDGLNIDFPFYRLLKLLRDCVGPRGTLLFPTFPNHGISSYEYLLRGEAFDVRKTPAYIGLLSEFARRQSDAVRSLHPTKSVCAIGPHAFDMISTHQNSRYPQDSCSPFYKLVDYEARIIGLGTWTSKLSFTYCVADRMKEAFPVRLYHDRVFTIPCIDYTGQTQIVETYAHNLRNLEGHDAPGFMKTYIAKEVCEDLTIGGMRFFTADAKPLFADMLRLAQQRITIYPPSSYSRD